MKSLLPTHKYMGHLPIDVTRANVICVSWKIFGSVDIQLFISTCGAFWEFYKRIGHSLISPSHLDIARRLPEP